MENGYRIIVCATCCASGRAPAGAALADALRVALPDVRVETQDCMSACAEPIALAFRAEGAAAYLFSGITPEDEADIIAFTRLWQVAPKGWIEDARPAGRLRFCLRGRIPA